MREAAARARLLLHAPWVRSPGYVRDADGVWIGPHEYLTFFTHPELFRWIAQLARTRRGYDGTYKGRTYRYVNIRGYKYWALYPILNRERLEGTDGPEQSGQMAV